MATFPMSWCQDGCKVKNVVNEDVRALKDD